MKNKSVMRGRARVVIGPKGIQELTAAVKDLSNWLTEKMKGKTQYGAFSMSALGEEAVAYFTERAVLTYFKGKWQQRDGETLRELLGRMVISDMGHALRKRGEQNGGSVTIIHFLAHPEKTNQKRHSISFQKETEPKENSTFPKSLSTYKGT